MRDQYKPARPSSSISEDKTCRYCGSIHSFVCPKVKAIEYYPDGSIKRVELKTAKDYPLIQAGISFPYWRSHSGDIFAMQPRN